MRIREWDPATAPEREIDAWLRVFNAVRAADLPSEPVWRRAALREYLSVAMPGERRAAWIAEEHGELVGYAGELLLGYDLSGAAVLELFTDPQHRRGGIGRALLATAARYAAAEQRQAVTAEVVEGTPTADFYAAQGFTRTVSEESSLLDLSTVDWDRIDSLAERTGAGYHIENYPGGPPDALLASYADAKLVIRHTPVADVEWNPGFEADRLRDSLRTLRARGLRPYVAVAIHTASGEVAGLTELVIPDHRPLRADQYDTIVVPAHRGYGLGLAMKARMLADLRTAEPQVREVQTWQAVEDEPMLRVNAVLGFRPDRLWCEYEAPLASLPLSLRTA
ncbi:MAG TPA: GNAT family N-acetyltransferase [Actinocatenispora sp.]